MSRIPALLSQLAKLHRQHIAVEHQIAEVERAIVASKNAPKPRCKRAKPASVVELTKPLLQALTDGGPLPRAEIAARLGLTQPQVTYRLQRALKAKLIERLGGRRYRVVDAVRGALTGAMQ
jgi:DNA-binding MarR family transcriptional regulator